MTGEEKSKKKTAEGLTDKEKKFTEEKRKAIKKESRTKLPEKVKSSKTSEDKGTIKITYTDKRIQDFFREKTGKIAERGSRGLSQIYKDWTKEHTKEINTHLRKLTKLKREIPDRIETLLEDFNFETNSSGVKISCKGDYICYLNWADNQHLKIGYPNNPLHKYFKDNYKEFEDPDFKTKLIQIIKNSIEEKKVDTLKALKEEKEIKRIKPDISIKKLKQLEIIFNDNLYNRWEDFRLMLYTVVSYFFIKRDCVFLIIINPKGLGKSTLCECLPDSDYVISTDNLTNEALAPGTPNEGDVANSLLDDCEDKTLITHDMSALLSSNEQKKDIFFGIMTNAYGLQPYKKYSPGSGNREYGGGFNFIAGITPSTYYKNKFRFDDNGRFLIYELRDLDQIEAIKKRMTNPGVEKIKMAVQGLLFNLNKEKKNMKEEIILPERTNKYIWEFFAIYQYYKLVWRSWNKDKENYSGDYEFKKKYKKDGVARPYNQLIMLCEAKCFVEGRKSITMKDVDYFKPIFYGMDNENTRKLKLDKLPEEYKLDNMYKLFDVEEITSTGKDLLEDTEIPDELEF